MVSFSRDIKGNGGEQIGKLSVKQGHCSEVEEAGPLNHVCHLRCILEFVRQPSTASAEIPL